MEDYYLTLNDTPQTFFAPKQLVDEFTEYCKLHGINKSAYFRTQMKKLLEE